MIEMLLLVFEFRFEHQLASLMLRVQNVTLLVERRRHLFRLWRLLLLELVFDVKVLVV